MAIVRAEALPNGSSTVAIEYWGHPYPFLARLVERGRGRALHRFLHKLTIDSISRRNPRNREYMLALMANSGLGESQLLTAASNAATFDRARLAAAKDIVLLWPDGNGTGWRSVERLVFAEARRDARIFVLNGRRRRFELSAGAWRGFLWRRAVEKTLLLEFVFSVVFVVTSPFLVLADVLRGRD